MTSQGGAVDSAGQQPNSSRSWSTIVGRAALVWALVEALLAGLANVSNGSLFGVSEQHFSLDAIVAALVGIGFILDGSARRPVSRG